MPSSYWKICHTGADGEQICTELYAEIPPELGPATEEVRQIATVDKVAREVTDASLQVRLLEALDDAALRLNTRLYGDFVLRRSDLAESGDRAAVGVPAVIGMTHVEGFQTLRAAGYQVKTVWEWTSSGEENMISDQAPAAGAPNVPPALVHIWVRTLPPDPPPDHTPAMPKPE